MKFDLRSTILMIGLITNQFIFAQVKNKDDLPINNGPRDAVLWFNLTGGGGASLVPLAPQNRNSEIKNSTSVGLSCDGFDPKVSIANMINKLRSGVNDTYNEILTSVKGTMVNMPGMIVQRAWPDWYGEFRRLFRQKYAKFQEAVQVCNRTVALLQNAGKTSAVFGFKKQEEAQAWKDEINKGNLDPDTIRKKVQGPRKSNGIIGFCGERQGGFKQQKIKLMQDAIRVGFNQLNQLDCKNRKSISGNAISKENSLLAHLFVSLNETQNWAVKVFGGEIVSFCSSNECAKEQEYTTHKRYIGIGVLEEIKYARKQIFMPLVKIVSGKVENKQENLNSVVNYMAPKDNPLHPVHIDALRDGFSVYDRGAAILKVAEELATIKVMLRTQAVYRMLVSGQRDPQVESFYKNNQVNFNGLLVVENELRILERDRRLTRGVTYPYLAAILIKANQKEKSTIRLQPAGNNNGSVFRNGAVQQVK